MKKILTKSWREELRSHTDKFGLKFVLPQNHTLFTEDFLFFLQVITVATEEGSTFSKASFAHTTSRSDIDIDDPDFWQKWAKKADIDLDAEKVSLTTSRKLMHLKII